MAALLRPLEVLVTRTLLRSNISAAATTLASLPEEEARIVVRHAWGTLDACRAALEGHIDREYVRRKLAERIPAPDLIRGTEGEDAWITAAWQARLGNDRHLDARLPQLAARETALATDAAETRTRAETELKDLRGQLAELCRREETFRKDSDSSLVLRGRLLTWGLTYFAMVGIEVLGVMAATAAALGLTGYPALRLVPAASWGLFGGTSLVASAFLVLLPFLLRLLSRGMSATTKLRGVGLALAIAAVLVLALIMGVLRFVGAVPVDAMTSDVAAIGGGALALLSLVGTPISVGFAWLASGEMSALAAEARAVRAEEDSFAREKVDLRKRITKHESDLAAAKRVEGRLATLRTGFEHSVIAAAHYADELQVERDARVQDGLAVFDALEQLSPAEREEVVNHVFIRTEALKATTASTFTRRVGALLLVGAIGSGTDGCAPPAPARSLIVACDPSGDRPEDVCSAALLAHTLEDWRSSALAHPGASLRIVEAAGSYESTVASIPIVVPGSFGGDPRLGMRAWKEEVRAQVDTFATKLEHPRLARANRSDLIALVALSARAAREEHGGVDLLLATDGRMVSLGFNAERKVPDAPKVLDRIEAAGIPWDLTAFASIRICGLHNAGVSAAEHAALDALWRGLIAGGGGPAPEIETSCRAARPVASPPEETGAREDASRGIQGSAGSR